MPTCVMPNAQGFLAVVADMSQTACEGGFVAITAARTAHKQMLATITRNLKVNRVIVTANTNTT